MYQKLLFYNFAIISERRTIFAAAESQHEEGVIYTGSDDGSIHLTKDGGTNWSNITPPDLPKWTMINSIEVDPFNKGGMLFAGTRYKLGDYQPYLYLTKDYGATWTKITSGIPSDHFTRVVRADPGREGLLYAGTESGMYISFDYGASWKPFQMNLPIVPITDLTIKNNNLIAATQGRAFWMIDDLTPLYQLNDQVTQSSFHLFKPLDSYRMGGGNGRTSKTAGTNHPGGVLTYFFLKDTSSVDTLALSFKELDGSIIKTFSNYPDKKANEEKLEFKEGMNMFNWDMIYEDAKTFDGMILWWSKTSGPMASPGKYTVELAVNGQTQSQQFELIKDPRSSATEADLRAQFDFLIEVRDKLSETHEAITNIRKAKAKINDVTKSLDSEEHKELLDKSKDVVKRMSAIEKELYQTKNESRQDPLNFPVKLNNKLGHLAALVSYGDNAPTKQDYEFKEEIIAKIDIQLEELYEIFNKEISEINQLIIENKIQLIELDE